MKIKLLNFFSKTLIAGLFMQCFSLSFLQANSSEAQRYSSVKDVYVTINLKNASLKEVFQEIEQKTNFLFTFDDKLISNTKVNISYSGVNNSVSDVLMVLSKEANLRFKQVNHNINVSKIKGNAHAPVIEVIIQGVTITGKVTDSDGEALPGVNVVVKGTSIGTVTDIDGAYKLDVPPASVLVFSYVGFLSEEVTINESSVIDIALTPDIQALEEIVVVGYGEQKKVNMTGAVSAVKIDDKITSRALTNVSSGLSGLVPGLAVTQATGMAGRNSANLLIRGMGTTNNANPLVVVDGMPDVDINRINMNDIESISVLKDAASSAVYGSRAANGVILITTKSGKGKPQINYSTSYAIEHPTKTFGFMPDYPRALTLHQRAADVNTARSQYLFKDGTIDQWMALGMIDPLRYPNTDWWDFIMRDGIVQNHNLSASGSNDNSNFFVSVGVMDEKGLQINNDYSRYNARFNYDYKIRNNWNVGAKFAGNWSKFVYALEDGYTDDNASNTAGFDMQYAIAGITPYDPITGYFGGTMAYNEDLQAYNPYTLYINNLTRNNRQEVNPSMYMDWTPFKGFTARVDYALNYYNNYSRVANIPNRAFNFQTGLFSTRQYVAESAGVSNNTSTGYKTQLNGRLSYNTIIADRHEINATVVYSEEYWYGRSLNASRNDRLHPTLSEIDAALTSIQTASGSSYTEGLRSYIGRVNYVAFDKYLFEVNFRTDGSSKFLDGNRYGFFPSAALGWRFNEESFMQNFSWLTLGKLRVSYGSLGNNSGVGRFEQQETLDAGLYMVNGNIVKGFVNSKMINPDLSWESTNVTNVGLDLGFLNNRLTVELDYYDRLTTGMLRPSEFSIHLSGAYDPAPKKNIGELRNRGIEGNFTWQDKFGELEYMFNLNASYNATVLERWNEFLGKGWVFLNMPYHFVYTYEDMGIAQTWQDIYNATPQGASPGDILRLDLNGDGRITGEDRKAYPHSQRDRPTTHFAFNSNFNYKNFDLVVLFQGSAGRKDYWLNNHNNVNPGSQRYAFSYEHWTNPWNWENRAGLWPRLGGNANREETSFWLDDMSYIRLKNIQLGYRVPQNILKNIGIDNLRIYGTAENLATFTKYRGLDPEKTGNRSDVYPLNKSYAIGVNVGI